MTDHQKGGTSFYANKKIGNTKNKELIYEKCPNICLFLLKYDNISDTRSFPSVLYALCKFYKLAQNLTSRQWVTTKLKKMNLTMIQTISLRKTHIISLNKMRRMLLVSHNQPISYLPINAIRIIQQKSMQVKIMMMLTQMKILLKPQKQCVKSM